MRKRRGWSEEEDELIASFLETNPGKYASCASLMTLRTEDAVRMRYMKLIGKEKRYKKRPRSEPPSKVDWKKEEDSLLLNSVSEMGKKWNAIAEKLEGRSSNATRNRYIRLMQERSKIDMESVLDFCYGSI